MATPQDKIDSGFTGLVLDNVNLGAPIKDNSNSKQILASGYYKYVSHFVLKCHDRFVEEY